jgi:hypothetical protein
MSTCGDAGGRTLAGEPCGRRLHDGGLCHIHAQPSEGVSDEELERIERAAATVQMDELCFILGYAERTFRSLRERDARIAAAYKKGRARVKAEAGATLLRMALGRREVVLQGTDGSRRVLSEEVEPHPASLFFLLKTQFGYRETDRREITGPEGGPVQVRGDLDLTKLKDEELTTLDQILRRAAVSSN